MRKALLDWRKKLLIRRKKILLTLVTDCNGDSGRIVSRFMEEEGVKRRTAMYFIKNLLDDGSIRKVKRGLYALPDDVSTKVALSPKVGKEVVKCQPISITKASDLKRIRIYNLAITFHGQPTIMKNLKLPQSTVSYHIGKLVSKGALREVEDVDPKQYRKGPNSKLWDELLVAYWNLEPTKQKRESAKRESAKKVGGEGGILASVVASDVEPYLPGREVVEQGDEGELVVVDWLPNVPVEVQSLMFQLEINEGFPLPVEFETWGNEKHGFGMLFDVHLTEYPFTTRIYLNQLSVQNGGGWKGWFHLPPFPVAKNAIREGIERMHVVGRVVGKAVSKALGLKKEIVAVPVMQDGEYKKNIQIAFSFPEGYFDGKFHDDGYSWWTDSTPTPDTWETRSLPQALIMGDVPRHININIKAIQAMGIEVNRVKMVAHGIERRSSYFEGRISTFFTEIRALRNKYDSLEDKMDIMINLTKDQTGVYKEILAEVRKDSPKDVPKKDIDEKTRGYIG